MDTSIVPTAAEMHNYTKDILKNDEETKKQLDKICTHIKLMAKLGKFQATASSIECNSEAQKILKANGYNITTKKVNNMYADQISEIEISWS